MPTPPHLRHRLPGFLALAIFTAAAGLVAAAGQPPEEEEAAPKTTKKAAKEDEDKQGGGIKKKIEIADPEGKKGSNPAVLLDELAQAAAAETRPALKRVYADFAVPFDRLTEVKGSPARIRPIPVRVGQLPAQFRIDELDAKNQTKEPKTLTPAEVKGVEHFEQLVLAEVERLGKDGSVAGGVTPDDRLAAGEKLLAAALRFHEYARANDLRRGGGKVWDDTQAALTAQLREVRVKQLQRAVGAADWTRVQEAGGRLAAAYPKDAGVEKDVAGAFATAADRYFQSGSHADKVRVRELLDVFDAALPGGGGEALKPARGRLTVEAKQLFELAVSAKAAGNLVDARNNVNRAEALDPTSPGLRELRNQLGSAASVLYVGARVFPERLSPATARWDSERQVVELLFEGAVEEVPDVKAGGRYRPGVAQGFPLVVPGGRDFLVRQTPRTATSEGFDTSDVVRTVELLRGRPHIWASAGLPWLDDLPAPTGGSAVRVGFRHGHPDPRALLTFKLLPGKWFADRGKPVDDPEYAAKPVGTTGPYRVHALPPPGSAGPRELVLAENPAYGKWKDRSGLPYLREVRFVELGKVADPLAEAKGGRLHVLPDLTRAEMSRLLAKGQSEFGGKFKVVTAATNRRVHILAANLRRPHLQNKALRRGLSLAIDREEVLNEVYRKDVAAAQRLFLAAMSGPFPPSSWATVKGPDGRPVALDNRPAGVKLLQEYLAAPGAVPNLELIYPTTDPLAKTVCEQLKAQVEGLQADGQRLATPDGKPLTLDVKGLSARDLLVAVQDESRFDLAYVPLEYPDDWYPFGLAAFLDPTAAGRGGRNWTGFRAEQTNPTDDDRTLGTELATLLEHRDFDKELRPRAERVHNYFNAAVPFIPLWQLDRHMMVPTGLRVYPDDGVNPTPAEVLNQTTLFSNAGRWRLE